MLMRDAFDEKTLFYLIQRTQIFLDYKYVVMEQAFQDLGQRFKAGSRPYQVIQKNLWMLQQLRSMIERWAERLEALEQRSHERQQSSVATFDMQGYYWFLNDQANGFECLKGYHRRLRFFIRALKSQLNGGAKYPELSSIQTLYYELDTCLDALRSLIHCIHGLVEGLLQQLERSQPDTFSRLMAHCKVGGTC